MPDIMSEVNTITPAKEARMIREIEAVAGKTPVYLNIRSISPLDMTVGFDDELAAYKLGFAYRDHWQSRVHNIERSKGVVHPGSYMVVLTPR